MNPAINQRQTNVIRSVVMFSNTPPRTPAQISPPVILNRQAFKSCHIYLPDLPKPVGAIAIGDQLFSYVRLYPTLEAAQRGSDRLTQRGNLTVLTQVPKGLVLWVLEPDARLA
jgi:hypothetical protein